MARRWVIDDCYGKCPSDATFKRMKLNGLAGAIWRVGEGLGGSLDDVDRQVNLCTDNDVPYAFYYAIHPWYDPIAQVDRFLDEAKLYHPSSIFLDDELHGTETKEQRSSTYYQAQDYAISKSPFVTGMYSGKWFIDQYAPMMTTWINKGPYWDASYPGFYASNWTEFNSKLAKLVYPSYPLPYPISRVWQFAGDSLFPMCNVKLDYSLIDDDNLYAHLFQGAKWVIPTYTVKIVTALFGVYLRSSESDQSLKVRWIPLNAKVLVDYEQNGWSHSTWNGLTGFIYSKNLKVA